MWASDHAFYTPKVSLSAVSHFYCLLSSGKNIFTGHHFLYDFITSSLCDRLKLSHSSLHCSLSSLKFSAICLCTALRRFCHSILIGLRSGLQLLHYRTSIFFFSRPSVVVCWCASAHCNFTFDSECFDIQRNSWTQWLRAEIITHPPLCWTAGMRSFVLLCRVWFWQKNSAVH